MKIHKPKSPDGRKQFERIMEFIETRKSMLTDSDIKRMKEFRKNFALFRPHIVKLVAETELERSKKSSKVKPKS